MNQSARKLILFLFPLVEKMTRTLVVNPRTQLSKAKSSGVQVSRMSFSAADNHKLKYFDLTFQFSPRSTEKNTLLICCIYRLGNDI